MKTISKLLLFIPLLFLNSCEHPIYIISGVVYEDSSMITPASHQEMTIYGYHASGSVTLIYGMGITDDKGRFLI